MNVYDALDAAYQHLAGRCRRPHWQPHDTSLDELVVAIRDDHPDPARSDATLRQLLAAAPHDPDAYTVALYALAPALRTRTERAVTVEYRADALTDLAFVLSDAIRVDRPRLAHRLVNRAHNRAHRAAGRIREHGSVQPTITSPTDPARFTDEPAATATDVGELAAQRVDLARFHHAVEAAVADGTLSAAHWDAYRAHRLARSVDPARPPCDGTQRQLARRAAARLQPYIDLYLHAA